MLLQDYDTPEKSNLSCSREVGVAGLLTKMGDF
jgi:hypothetical protein